LRALDQAVRHVIDDSRVKLCRPTGKDEARDELLVDDHGSDFDAITNLYEQARTVFEHAAVERSATEVLDAPTAAVVAGLRSVLAQRPYRGTTEGPEVGRFQTTVKTGSRWLDPVTLGTDLEVWLTDLGDKTQVSVRTRSQSLIAGDVFGMYDRYIQGLLTNLRATLSSQSPPVSRQ
jgi:hypothetical protein